nr:heavy metal translocating P-type ATPase [Sphingorhabdus soli]
MSPAVAPGPADASSPIDSRFIVPGMRCAGCIGKIERGLLAVDGVVSARVNFSAKRVAVRHRPDIDDRDLVNALERIGFEAQALADAPFGEDRNETRSLLKALAVAGFGMMNIMLLSVGVWSGADGATREIFHWLSAMIAIPVVAYAGRPFFISAAKVLRQRHTNMDVPISIGVLLATGLSLYETATGGAHAYFDGAVMLLFFLLAGRVLDAMMRDRARQGIGALMKHTALQALVVGPAGDTQWVAAAALEPGQVMIVAAGENLAADGVIVKGSSAFDNAMLTGESEPQARGEGDTVLAGTTNVGAPVSVRVTAAGGDTTIADLARLMDDVGQHRSFYVRVADRAARIYAPAVHSLALATFAGWMIAGAGLHQSLLVAISVLIITCPCALGLAVPAAQVVAVGALLKRGVLIKDGSALERLASVDRAVFDKTGTLTLGTPHPVSLEALSDDEKSIALALASASRHPLSRALHAALASEAVGASEVGNISEVPGVGISGRWQGQIVSLGRADNPSVPTVRLTIGDRSRDISFRDQPRADVGPMLVALERLGIESSILSGDAAGPVGRLANAHGLSFVAAADPRAKVDALKALADEGRNVLMVGDGLNDGPALAAAHVSMAPGTASDVGQQAADAVFTSPGIMPVALAVRVARQTRHIVRENFALAIAYNAFAVPIAIAGLVTPLVAAIAMSMSSLIVVGNALRLAGSAK